jgi:hypothetical protein
VYPFSVTFFPVLRVINVRGLGDERVPVPAAPLRVVGAGVGTFVDSIHVELDSVRMGPEQWDEHFNIIIMKYI